MKNLVSWLALFVYCTIVLEKCPMEFKYDIYSFNYVIYIVWRCQSSLQILNKQLYKQNKQANQSFTLQALGN